MIQIEYNLGYWEVYINNTFFDSSCSLEGLLKKINQNIEKLQNEALKC